MTLYGKERVLSRLDSFVSSGRLPHGLLLCGEKGAGKGVIADYIARLFLCESHVESGGHISPCGVCNACYKALSRIHPDIVYALSGSDNGKYKIDLLREIISGGSVLPNDGSVRVYIFESLDEMSELCQNTLLKFIEEPLPFNRFVFTASSVSSILPTIISRLTALTVEPPEDNDCVKALVEGGMSAEEANGLVMIYGGNIGRCLEGSSDEGKKKLVAAVRNVVGALTEKNEYKVCASLTALGTRELLIGALVMLQEVYRDAVVFALGGNKLCSVCRDLVPALSASVSPKRLSSAIDMLEDLIARMEFNPNVQLVQSLIGMRLYRQTTE